MRISVSNLAAPAMHHFDSFCEIEQGLPPEIGVEYFVLEFDQDYMRALRNAVKQASNHRRISLHGPFIGIEATSAPGTQEYAKMLDAYEQAFEIAALLENRTLVFHCNECFVTAENKERLQRQSLENVEALIEKAREQGVTLLLENLGIPTKGLPLYDFEEYIGYINKFPQAASLVDIGHANLTGWHLPSLLQRIGGRIEAYHIHNNDGREDSHSRLEDGTLNMSEFFQAAAKFSPDAEFVLEYIGTPAIGLPEILRDIHTMRRLFSC